jgi:hypothetical protein
MSSLFQLQAFLLVIYWDKTARRNNAEGHSPPQIFMVKDVVPDPSLQYPPKFVLLNIFHATENVVILSSSGTACFCNLWEIRLSGLEQ